MRVQDEPRNGDDGTGDAATDAAPPSSLSPHAYRLTGLRPSSIPPPPEEGLLRTIADVLIAVAHADGAMCDREKRTIARILTELSGKDGMPRWLQEHVDAFEP